MQYNCDLDFEESPVKVRMPRLPYACISTHAYCLPLFTYKTQPNLSQYRKGQ